MQMISMILSGLALLAAGVSLILTIHEKKRSEKRNAALIQYADASVKELEKRIQERLEKLEQGITPDYEQAKAAAEAVNNFSRGVSNILGFDPLKAYQAAQRREKMGGDSE